MPRKSERPCNWKSNECVMRIVTGRSISITALGAYVAIGVLSRVFILGFAFPSSLNSRRSSLLLVMRISGWCGFLASKPRQFR